MHTQEEESILTLHTLFFFFFFHVCDVCTCVNLGAPIAADPMNVFKYFPVGATFKMQPKCLNFFDLEAISPTRRPCLLCSEDRIMCVLLDRS